jgi:S1-C subfamily serine protease
MTAVTMREIDPADPVTEVALALIARDGITTFRPSGSAVIIAPYLAITAKHVLADHWRAFDYRELPTTGHATGVFSLQAFQVVNNGRDGALWDITRLWSSGHTDIAFLRLTPASDTARAHQNWRPPRLNLLPPDVGAAVTGFGYRDSTIESLTAEGIVWRHTPTMSDGMVLEVHDTLRDSGSLTFPCFRTDAPFVGGMSGGPVFDDAGDLRGLICYSLAPITPNGEYVSYAASLWGAMATPIDFRPDGTTTDSSYPALFLARDGVVAAQNWDRVRVSEPDEHNRRSVSITVPS